MGTLASTSINIEGQAGAASTLRVFVTEQGNFLPVSGTTLFTSGFSSSSVPVGWTVTEQAYVDLGNGLFTTPTLLGIAVCTAPGPGSCLPPTALTLTATAAPYSITEVFTIQSNGTAGFANSDITVTAAAVPGPVAGTGLVALAGLAGAWFMRRRRQAGIQA